MNLVTVPCLGDNYAFLLHDEASGLTALVDAPESGPILAELRLRGWDLHEVWLTHHHADHVDGLPGIKDAHRVTVTGCGSDSGRLPPLDRAVEGGDRFEFAGHPVEVIAVPGHTSRHIAFHVPDAGAVFTADSLMALGCGRLFEGTAEEMWRSLERLAALPDETLVCSGHEYTASNARFALTVDPDNSDLRRRAAKVEQARTAGQPTVPSTLAEEKATNPFLRARLSELKRAIDMEGAGDIEAFAEIRRRKDRF